MVRGNPFYGRGQVIRFVRDLMAREEMGRSLRNQHSPVLIVEGARGTGKTALLSGMVELLDQRVPHAELDVAATGGASITQVLSALAFELGRKCPLYGALQFPRFTIGQVVRELDLDPNDHARARGQVIEALVHGRWIDAVRKDLVNWAGPVLAALVPLGVPVEPPRNTLMLMLRSLTARAPARIVLGVNRDWYGHRDLGLKNDSIDVLVVLNRWFKNKKDKISRQRVDELLLEAFLADLRHELDRGRRADERSLNCVILLDNADSRLGRRFLRELVRARQRVAGRHDDADPLTVVATSREAWLGGVPDADWEVVTLDEGPPPRRSDWSAVWWLRHQLTGITEIEIADAVEASAPPTVDYTRAGRVLYGLTKGHGGSLRLAVEALARNPPMGKIEPEVILSQPPPGEDSDRWPAVEDQMLGRLLDLPTAKTPMRDLVTCAAARELRHALSLAAQDDLVGSDQANYLKTHEQVLWPPGEVELALARRLLQRRLARRDPAVVPSWSTVYGRLRDACRCRDGDTAGDDASELYYTLAVEDLELVTRRLHQCLAELDDQAWLDLLKSVTAAPRREPSRQAPLDEVLTVVHAAALEEPLTVLARLIAALWIAADPFINSERGDLHQQIVDDYIKVAELTQRGLTDAFRKEIGQHSKQVSFWGRLDRHADLNGSGGPPRGSES